MIGSCNVCVHVVCKTVLECNEITMPVKNNLGNEKKLKKICCLHACIKVQNKLSLSQKNGCRPTS